jgi:hypothetical protein
MEEISVSLTCINKLNALYEKETIFISAFNAENFMTIR